MRHGIEIGHALRCFFVLVGFLGSLVQAFSRMPASMPPDGSIISWAS